WHGCDAQEQRQRVRRDVVRRLGRPARIQPQVGVPLRLEQRFREGGVGLPQLDDVAPRTEPLPAHGDGLERGADLDLAAVQNPEQRGEAYGVLALSRNYVRVRPPLPTPDSAPADGEKVGKPAV